MITGQDCQVCQQKFRENTPSSLGLWTTSLEKKMVAGQCLTSSKPSAASWEPNTKIVPSKDICREPSGRVVCLPWEVLERIARMPAILMTSCSPP